MTARDPALQELLDRTAIHDLLIHYARAVDAKDLEAVTACFTNDASYQGSLGTGAIDRVLAALPERWTRYEKTTHFLASPLIGIVGQTATSDAMALVHHRYETDGEERDFVVSVRYQDDLVQRDSRWLIRRRRASVEWQRTDPVVVPPDFT